MQAAAGIGEPQAAKAELHITLWHANDPPSGAVTPLDTILAHDGATLPISVSGFFCAPGISAAAVALRGAAESWRRPVPPHATMRFEQGVDPVAAGDLPGRHARGDPAVAWVPLAESSGEGCAGGELQLDGTVSRAGGSACRGGRRRKR
jgi:hypothetical protein